MRLLLPALALLAASTALAQPSTQDSGQDSSWTQQRIEWNKPMKPFRIAGNVYYVGTAGLSAYLIADPRGLVLIDGGLPESAPDIAASILALGYRLEDVKYLLINHAHFDHAGGLARLKHLTGARLLASPGDRPDLEHGRTAGRADLLAFPPVKVDHVLADGEHIRLGAIDLVTHLTPGHTRGCTSWSLRVVEGAKPLNIVFACSLTVAGQDLRGGSTYLTAAGDFRRTFARLRSLRADIFLNFHPSAFGFDAKRAKLLAGDKMAFVDPGELRRQVEAAQTAFEAELAKQKPAKPAK